MQELQLPTLRSYCIEQGITVDKEFVFQESADAKIKALREVGVLIPNTFDDLEPLLKQQFQKISKEKKIPMKDNQPNVTVPMDYAAAVKKGLVRKATNITTTVFAVFLAYAYSAPPLRLKEKPLIDSLSNSLAVMALLMLGFSYGGTLFEFPDKFFSSVSKSISVLGRKRPKSMKFIILEGTLKRILKRQ